ncbi:hypothetical protein CVT25_015000 [Psilocybe cyanescens]|uniref:Uncharacterized protein n=1 Tax=Psilocybe cyanescens TaxID=93625 RepID=A0A409XI97_PSICY|nr:hypothetical protein CVT25_015000 [Psilocybe cyanescens]
MSSFLEKLFEFNSVVDKIAMATFNQKIRHDSVASLLSKMNTSIFFLNKAKLRDIKSMQSIVEHMHICRQTLKCSYSFENIRRMRNLTRLLTLKLTSA